MNIAQLKLFKQSNEKITCLTAYDASFAQLFDECGVDVILVGDSLGNVIQGGENTLGV
ncbi:MAG TPA: 3-methyl-2-oxobutanoate hydroxymethyltransferase, partial [Candidatus Thioglobus sp.]|nr:3-methyl-2-oxobutanoate hydroxymethyltransferase [Candidatus Thioglobus sp.]